MPTILNPATDEFIDITEEEADKLYPDIFKPIIKKQRGRKRTVTENIPFPE